LADIYSSGLGGSRDRKLAKALYLKSQDDPGATFHHLGRLFDGKVSESGLQIQKDESEAVFWYYAAAAQGHREAQLVISQAYREGTYGLARDASKAEYWQKLSTSER
jgi:TPR repeat protein